MSLNKNSFISATDFNSLKNSIANEVLRRAPKSNFPTSGQTNSLGNDYNKDTFSFPSDIEEKEQYNDIITKNYMNKILNFFKNFKYDNSTTTTNYYPEDLNSLYRDDSNVNIGDIVYALNSLIPYLEQLNQEDRHNNDCRGNCMGLCRDECSGNCTNDCTGGCKGGCNTGCTNTCAQQCTSCTALCVTGCETDPCHNTCSGTCNNTCTMTCVGECVWEFL